VALKRLDDLEGAERSLTKAHALAPQDPLILINYAVVLDARGKQADAAEILTALNDIMAVVEVDVQVIYIYVCVCVCARARARACVCVCIHIYTDIYLVYISWCTVLVACHNYMYYIDVS